MNDDANLLQRFAETGCAESFTTLVERHVDLVYGAALRRTGNDPHRAADVAQEVFAALARNAGKLVHHAALAAWLHAATRNAALNLMISEQRRKERERAAVELAAVDEPALPAEWQRVRPVLDAAIDELPEPDRVAIVLRFLECREFAEIGAALGASADAARMRTDRALEKLRLALVRRGITSTATAIGTAVSSYGSVTAPAGLSSTLVAGALAAASAGGGVLAALATFMNVKTLLVSAALGAAGFGLGSYVQATRATVVSPVRVAAPAVDAAGLVSTLRSENARLQARLDDLSREIGQLNTTNAQLTARLAARPAAVRPMASLGKPPHEAQTAMLDNLRRLAAVRDQFKLENGRYPKSIDELVGPRAFLFRVETVEGEDYGELRLDGGPMTVTTPGGLSVTYDPQGGTTTQIEVPAAVRHARELEKKIEPAVTKARRAYRVANGGRDPEKTKDLLPYFATPQEGADYVEMMDAKSATRGL